MADLLHQWLTPDGIALFLLLTGLLVSLFKGKAAASKFNKTASMLQVVLQGVEDYREASSPEEKAKIRDHIQAVAEDDGVEEALNKVVKDVTDKGLEVRKVVK